MNLKKVLYCILSFILVISLISGTFVTSSALIFLETQYTYDKPNTAWLKDIIIKDDMRSISGLTDRCTLMARPDYLYTNTPESFLIEVNELIDLYELDSDSQRASYFYIFETLSEFSTAGHSEISDEYIKFWLQENEIAYPSDGLYDPETTILARALYIIMNNEAINQPEIENNATIESTLIKYFSPLLGVDLDTTKEWSADSNLDTMNKYILATCRLALWNSGYDVSPSTPDEEVYRLIAIMTIKKQGISVDESTADFEELKIKYLAAMLSLRYGVSLEPDILQSAIDNNSVALYILQLMGQDGGISIKHDTEFTTAFFLVAENTDFFDIIPGEFYSDILKYDVKLEFLRDSIWINPTALYKTDVNSNQSVTIKINNIVVKDNYYSEYLLNPEIKSEKIFIEVSNKSTNSQNSLVYEFNIIQGNKAPEPSTNPVNQTPTNNSNPTDSIITDFFPSFNGFDIAGITGKISFEIPPRIVDIMSLLIPSFDLDISNSFSDSSDFLSSLLDKSSSLSNSSLGGVGGLDDLINTSDLLDVTFEPIS